MSSTEVIDIVGKISVTYQSKCKKNGHENKIRTMKKSFQGQDLQTAEPLKATLYYKNKLKCLV